MTAAIESPVLNPQLQAIIDAPLPSVRRASLRREERKVWAKEARSLLKSMGLSGIKVTTPNYSMAQSIDIDLPRSSPEPIIMGDDGHPTHHPAYRAQRNAAHDKIKAIILAAFPDLDDRSDHISDYYDFCLSVH